MRVLLLGLLLLFAGTAESTEDENGIIKEDEKSLTDVLSIDTQINDLPIHQQAIIGLFLEKCKNYYEDDYTAIIRCFNKRGGLLPESYLALVWEHKELTDPTSHKVSHLMVTKSAPYDLPRKDYRFDSFFVKCSEGFWSLGILQNENEYDGVLHMRIDDKKSIDDFPAGDIQHKFSIFNEHKKLRVTYKYSSDRQVSVFSLVDFKENFEQLSRKCTAS